MLIRVFVIVLFFYFPLSYANTYTRGDIHCSDFRNTESKFKSNPSGGYAVAYGICLLAKGQEDVRALNILEVEASRRNQVSAADILALYISTGGTMDRNEFSENNCNEAFLAYGRVIHLINLHNNYPEGFMITESERQTELQSYRYLIWASYFKFYLGLDGTDNTYLLQSPSYQGSRDLKLYPKYSPYTLTSLEQTIENAEKCASLPQKAHFQPLIYNQTMEYCRMMSGVSQGLLDLERERLTLLNDPSCARDIEVCTEYQKVFFDKIFPLIEERKREDKRIWSSTSIEQLE